MKSYILLSIVSILLSSKLHCTLPLHHNIAVTETLESRLSSQEQVNDTKKRYNVKKLSIKNNSGIDIQKITSEIKDAIRQLKEDNLNDDVDATLPNCGEQTKVNLVESVGGVDNDESGNQQQGRVMENDQGNLRDLRQYEKLVISKKYPYLDLEEFKSRQPLMGPSVNQKRSELNLIFTGDQGICEIPDDVRNIEIINRGLSGFDIPQFNRFGALEEKHQTKKAKTPQSFDKVNDLSLDDNIVGRLKKLIVEYEEKKRQSKTPLSRLH